MFSPVGTLLNIFLFLIVKKSTLLPADIGPFVPFWTTELPVSQKSEIMNGCEVNFHFFILKANSEKGRLMVSPRGGSPSGSPQASSAFIPFPSWAFSLLAWDVNLPSRKEGHSAFHNPLITFMAASVYSRWCEQSKFYMEKMEGQLNPQRVHVVSSEISTFYLTEFSLGFHSQGENNLDFFLTVEKNIYIFESQPILGHWSLFDIWICHLHFHGSNLLISSINWFLTTRDSGWEQKLRNLYCLGWNADFDNY